MKGIWRHALLFRGVRGIVFGRTERMIYELKRGHTALLQHSSGISMLVWLIDYLYMIGAMARVELIPGAPVGRPFAVGPGQRAPRNSNAFSSACQVHDCPRPQATYRRTE